MALSNSALTTLQAVKDELGISGTGDDAYLERQIERYSSLLSEATNRNFHSVTGHTEKTESWNTTTIEVTDHLPLSSISEIKINGDVVDSSAYEIEDSGAGIIRNIDSTWESSIVATRRIETTNRYAESTVEVTYSGGYVTPEQSGTRDLPYSIEGAIIDAVTYKYRERGKHPGITSESLGDASVSYSSPDTESVGGMDVPVSFADITKRYKIRYV